MAGLTKRISDWGYYCGESLTLKLTGKGPPRGWRGRAFRLPSTSTIGVSGGCSEDAS